MIWGWRVAVSITACRWQRKLVRVGKDNSHYQSPYFRYKEGTTATPLLKKKKKT